MAKRSDFKTIDEYLETFSGTVKNKLVEMRGINRKAVPEAEEAINYQIPTFKLIGKYVGYFAGFKDHLSFYPIPFNEPELAKEMAPYVAGKGTPHFTLDKLLSSDLIAKIVKSWVKYRKENK